MIVVETAWIAIAAVAVLAAALAGVAVAQRRARTALASIARDHAALQARCEELRREAQAAVALAVKAGDRLRKMEQATAQFGDRLGKLELRGEGRPYDQAINLVRHGADADRLVQNLGLSRGEADLVTLLHGNRRHAG